MMASDTSTFRGRLLYALHVTPGGSLLFALIPMVLFGYLGWYYYAAGRIDRTFYSLKIDQIQISTQPDWIKSPVLEEVYRQARLDRINTLDPSANADIASAFETHPWVERATRVQKFSGTVTVDLKYRKPVAMVQVPYQDRETGKWKEGFYPVDIHGVVLPVSDFSQSQVLEYVWIDIENIDRTPEGMAYADARVHHALKMADFLESQSMRRKLGIQWISVRRDNDLSTGKPWIIQLLTEQQQQITWGHAPGDEATGELPAEHKLIELAKWIQLEREKGAQASSLDLSTGRPASTQPASAKSPKF